MRKEKKQFLPWHAANPEISDLQKELCRQDAKGVTRCYGQQEVKMLRKTSRSSRNIMGTTHHTLYEKGGDESAGQMPSAHITEQPLMKKKIIIMTLLVSSLH